MQKIYPVKIGDVIDKLLSDNQLAQQGLLESRALEYWRQVVGDRLAEATQKINLREGKLYVSFSSQAARSEFFMRRTEIRSEINRLVGANVIKFISIF
ncbi:MAG: DUF721 domain-containing protein [Rikenellaceae bacterium]